jgi:hypothetical protein
MRARGRGLLIGAAAWRLAAAQGGAAVTSPARPTVGDTIWLSRDIALPRGWGVRAATFTATEAIEPLGDPVVERTATGWRVRVPVVAWVPGTHRVELPPVWRLAPDGRADSSAGGTASITVASVLPDTLAHPEPQGLLTPLRRPRRNPLPLVAALSLALALLAAGVGWRRRAPPASAPPTPPPLEPEVPDARWLAAGEPKGVATRASWRLRAALAQAVPAAHPALSTAECLAVLEHARPTAPLREIRDVLEQLERAAFAPAQGGDVIALATMARRLARDLAP